ncbi:MAG TPA: 3-hydroxy-5-phosphonooxypentane-2,4-dione thiolase [Candidatus Eisenbacteria bacterium]|uniref:3-hydroxy-5-phosphonooxypentane-2,4-dione thiolase n=1 Tax=Eiseniibacteriota bacterium TaxID=2212470 RepID=A0A7V2F3P7_UNCEI|nr:3-hydroxy-5-phosphonooxypentane-2,4-dione thiolase [Candidatus Eisenbacteria bacterium]
MQWGIKNRLARIFNPETGRTVMLAVDHGYFLGPTRKLENPRETIAPLIPYADALMLTRGVLRNCVDPESRIPAVLRVSGGVSIVGPSLADEGLTTSFEDAIRLNVSAVTMSIFVGTEHERETLLNLAELVDQGETYGIPVLAVTAVGKELEKRDARFLSLCCRIAAEIGAHYVKTYYCEDFEKVVESCPVPVVIAGGPQLDSFRDTLQLAHDAIARGARGVDMGRNIWQDEHPVAAIRSVRGVVQENMPVDEAFELYRSVAGR